MNSKFLYKLCILASMLLAAPGFAQDAVKIGILNDQSGPFASYQGIGSVVAAKMAVEDYGGKAGGKPVEVVAADHQNKTDIGIGIARRWYENDGVDAIFDLPELVDRARCRRHGDQKNKVFVGSGAGTVLLTGEKCTPNTVHWTYDTYAYGRGLGKAMVRRAARNGSSSPPTTRSVTISRSRPRKRSKRPAARCSAPSGIRWERPTTPPSCCRPRLRVPTSSASPMPATTPSPR